MIVPRLQPKYNSGFGIERLVTIKFFCVCLRYDINKYFIAGNLHFTELNAVCMNGEHGICAYPACMHHTDSDDLGASTSCNWRVCVSTVERCGSVTTPQTDATRVWGHIAHFQVASWHNKALYQCYGSQAVMEHMQVAITYFAVQHSRCRA